MRAIAICIICLSVIGCKNNGSNTASSNKEQSKEKIVQQDIKQIIVGEQRKPEKPDFQVLDMTCNDDMLTVTFQYSGGCEEHDFNAHFSGGWLKSMPPQAVLDFEHVNPKNDACRKLIKDSVQYDLIPLRYPGSQKVIVKYGQQSVQTLYEYAN